MALSNAALRKMQELRNRVRDEDPRGCLVAMAAGEEPVLYELLAVGLMQHAAGSDLALTDEGLRWLADHGAPDVTKASGSGGR